MTEFEKEEFWKALERHYDESVQLRRTTEALRDVAVSHEKRLDKAEVIVQWLTERERKREKEEGGL
jgi:hypothetical protein